MVYVALHHVKVANILPGYAAYLKSISSEPPLLTRGQTSGYLKTGLKEPILTTSVIHSRMTMPSLEGIH